MRWMLVFPLLVLPAAAYAEDKSTPTFVYPRIKNYGGVVAMENAAEPPRAGAKVVAMTMVDLITQPALVQAAWDYFRNVQTKDTKYQSLLSPDDKPPVWLNRKIMAEYREQMRKFYFDPSRYDTYMEQLGIKYPTVRAAPAAAGER